MKSNIENALYHCGRDRVMQREFGGTPSVAIRWDGDRDARVTSPDGTKFLVRDAETIDEAGHLAAIAFAARLREVAKSFEAQAARIILALERDA